MIRAREARSSSSWARVSACRRSLSSASRAAAATSSTSAGSSSSPGRCERNAHVAPARETSGRDLALEPGRPAARVHEPVAAERVGELEVSVAELRGERVAEAARGRRLRELEHEPREVGTGPARAQPAPRDGERQRAEDARLREPETPVEQVVVEKAASDAVRELRRDEPEIDGARDQNGAGDPPARRARAHEREGRQQSDEQRPREAEGDADPVEVGVCGTASVDEQEISCALRTALRGRVEDDGREQADDTDRADVRHGDCDTLRRP